MKPGDQWTSVKTTPIRQAIQSWSRCFWVHTGRCATTKTRRWQETPHRLLLHHAEWSSAKLWNIQARTPSNHWMSQTLETIPSQLTSWDHSPHWPCQPYKLAPATQNQQTHCETSTWTRRVQYQIATRLQKEQPMCRCTFKKTWLRSRSEWQPECNRTPQQAVHMGTSISRTRTRWGSVCHKPRYWSTTDQYKATLSQGKQSQDASLWFPYRLRAGRTVGNSHGHSLVQVPECGNKFKQAWESCTTTGWSGDHITQERWSDFQEN